MRSVFTITTPLPPTVTRETVIEMLHDHGRMIELNPLVINHERCRPPRDASPDEFHCIWYEVTDKMSYLPGISGTLKFHCCFNDIPIGVQTHVYAPMGLDIQERWSVGGNLPGEPREPREIGVSVPRDVLYIREDVNMNVNRVFTSFVKTKLNKAHRTLVDRLLTKGEIIEDIHYEVARSETMSQSDGSSVHHPMSPTLPHQRLSAHPYRTSTMSGFEKKGIPSPQLYPPAEGDAGYHHPQHSPYPNSAHSSSMQGPPSGKSFISELPGSVPSPNPQQPPAELYSTGRPSAGVMKFDPPPVDKRKKSR